VKKVHLGSAKFKSLRQTGDLQASCRWHSTLQARVNALKDEREVVLTEMAGIKQDRPSPRNVSPKQVRMPLSG